eukprot:jgi/Tetstr1/434615/TSEL_023706.t1
MLAKEAGEQSPCCSRKCVHKLYTQCGEILVDAVMDRALTVYSGNKNRSFDRLAHVLRRGYKSASDKFDYMFDHGGYLRSFDHRGPIYTYDLGHVDIMPFHDGNIETFKKHIPPWMTKICVYCSYKSWAEDDNAILRESEVKLASFDTFRRTWKEDFPDVTTPKTMKPDMLLKHHLTFVKYDGYRPDNIYYYTNTITHDSSTTCTLIWITIMKIFSRISLALSRSSAYTIEAFLDLVAKAFSPTPEIAELSFSLDFSEWLRPHFQDHIQDISKRHKFKFTRDDDAASGGSLRTALWSNTPLSEPVQILKNAPTGTPEIRAGRPLLYALCDKKKPDAVKVQRYLDDFKKAGWYITDLAVQWHLSLERESWKNMLDDLDEMQTAPSAAFSRLWPQRKEEDDDFLREHGQTAPAEARHTLVIGLVKSRETTEDMLTVAVYEPFHADAKGEPLMPLWLYAQTKGGKKPVDTSWEKLLALPWKLVEAVPLSYAKAIHDASGSREVFNEDGTMVRKKCQPGRAARTNPRYPNHDDTMFLDLSSDEDEDVVGSGSEWEYEGSDEEDELELSPTTGRILTAPERLVTHGTVARGAAYCLPCLAEAEALNITDVNGGQPTGLLYKIPAGTLCRSCKQDAISRFIPQDVEAEKTMVRYKVFKGLAGAKGGISGKYTEWPFTGVGVLEALAYREGMKELERFLGLTDFSSRCFKVFFFAPAGTIRAPVPPLTLSVRSSEYGKGTKLYTMKVVYNVVTLSTVTSGQWDWPQHFPADIEKWPRRPPLEYAKPRTTIEATLEAGLRRCWKKQYHADLLVSAELALYRRNVAHEEVTPAATPAVSPTPGQPDGRVQVMSDDQPPSVRLL